jgi:hypothetical protein
MRRRAVDMRTAAAWVFAGLGVLALVVSIVLAIGANASATRQIQEERARSVYANCMDINRRHDNSIRQLDALIAQAPPERRERAKAGRAGTVLLIQALVPKRDCDALVKRSVTTRH